MRRLSLAERRMYRMAFRFALQGEPEGLMLVREELQEKMASFQAYELKEMVELIEGAWQAGADVGAEGTPDDAWRLEEQGWLHAMLAAELGRRGGYGEGAGGAEA